MAEIQLSYNVYKVEYSGKKSFSKHRFSVNIWTWNKVDYAVKIVGEVMSEVARLKYCDEDRKLEEIFTGIKMNNIKEEKLTIPHLKK